MPTAGVDFFRVDRSGPTKVLLAIATVLISAGATSVGAHLVTRLDPSTSRLVSLIGGVTMLSGLVLGFGAMAMMLFENVYLVIGEKGVTVHENGKETTIAWADLEGVELDESFVVLRRRDDEPMRWFAGKVAKDISARVGDARRKAIHGLLSA